MGKVIKFPQKSSPRDVEDFLDFAAEEAHKANLTLHQFVMMAVTIYRAWSKK